MNEFSTKLITAITKHWVICKKRKKNKQVSLQLMQSQESRQKWLTNVQKHTTLSLQQKNTQIYTVCLLATDIL